MNFRRYAIYYTPPQGALAEFGASWLGWDAGTGREVTHSEVAGLARDEIARVTDTPRKYGFHGTLKAPFRLADGTTEDALAGAVDALAARLSPVMLEALIPARLGGFLALVPEGVTAALEALAAQTVRELDVFRAPSSEADLARRRKAGLSDRQEGNLRAWGYPYVMQDFRFHMTLTGRLDVSVRNRVLDALNRVLPHILPRPFPIEALTLAGEDADGRFHTLHRYTLSQ